ncbi:MAG: CDP-archaeol synthase [Gammaproteobacteria bacterium]
MIISISKFLALVILINGAPILIRFSFKQRLSMPVDFNYRLGDGQFLFGPTKTWSGIVAAVIMGSIVAPILGYAWYLGVYVALASMSGDLFSSFVKRRMGMPSSSMALFLDQLPEVLFPALLCMQALQLSFIGILYALVIFVVAELLLSQLLYKWGIRKQPF